MSINSTLDYRVKMAQELSPQKKFVPARLPWVVAGGALLVYLLTLNHWVSLSSLWPVARASGWDWRPELLGPLYWLVTWPFHFLPLKTIPVALNLFSALCAFLTLALLARSVALLPHDRTEEQRIRERNPFALLSIRSAWVGPVLAVIACGLQLSFWESATSASRDMFDLLLFAYVVRCVLEFRIDGRDSWLLKASFVYGAAMTNNWAMIAFFPVFLTALIWSKGIGFFNARFLGRMFVLGTVGLCFYLLLPLVNSFSSTFDINFWQALKFNLGAQKTALATIFHKQLLFSGDHPWWVLALPSLLPVLAMSIRWPSYFGDPSKLGVALATAVFHFLYASLFLFCAWMALDPALSPRYYDPALAGLVLLPFYYLGALSIGYFAGYFLLVFGTAPTGRFVRPVPGYMRVFNSCVTGAVWLLLLCLPVGLVYRSLPQVRMTNGPVLRDFANLMAKPLPAKGAVVLSDDVSRLFLVQAALAQAGEGKDCIFLETHALTDPGYHRYLKKLHHQDWLTDPPRSQREQYKDGDLQRLVAKLGESHRLFYLHPSFGYYFEIFYPRPHGLVNEMIRFPTNTLFNPPLTQKTIQENEKFWADAYEQQLKPLQKWIQPARPRQSAPLPQALAQRIHLLKEPNRQALFLASCYSRSLDFWGVQLQRNNDLTNAAAHFRKALELNPDNVAARVNLECNANLQAGRKSSIELTKSITERFGKYRTWEDVMNFNGPFDEPTFCFRQGEVLTRGNNANRRQGAEEFARARVLAPDDVLSRLRLGQLLFFLNAPDQALKVTEELHSLEKSLDFKSDVRVQLYAIESASHLVKGDVKGAEKVLDTALKQSPGDEALLAKATQIYMEFKDFTNSLKVIDMRLKAQPDQPFVLLQQGCSYLNLDQYDKAIPPLTRITELETNLSDLHYFALFNRAVAEMKGGKLEDAQRDYDTLQQAIPGWFQVHYGLGQIAYLKKDTNAAIRNYNLYLANVPTNYVEEIKEVRDRLKALRRIPE